MTAGRFRGSGGTFRLEPPRLRTTADPREERHATWFELFFDLVFVAAVAQLGAALAADPSAADFARFAAVFVMVLWAWVLYTLYANRVDTADLIFRLAKSWTMLAIARRRLRSGSSRFSYRVLPASPCRRSRWSSIWRSRRERGQR